MYIINDIKESAFNVKAVEERYNAKYMGEWCLKNVNGNWVDQATSVFYEKNPDKSLGHTHYFALFMRGGRVIITKGDVAFHKIQGAIASNGEVVVSRYRHDYRESTDESVFVDGGRDYTRTNSDSLMVDVTVNNGKFYVKGLELEVKRGS